MAAKDFIHEKFFVREEIKFVTQRLTIRVLVVNVDSEEIVQWTS